MIIICRNSFWVKVNLVKLHSLQLMQCRHPGSQAKAAAASSNREGKEKMKNDDFFVGKKWNRSRSSSKNSIHFCCQRNSIKKREGDLNYFNFKSWKLSFHLQKEVLFSQLDLFSFFPIIFVEDPFIFWNEKKRSLLKL